MKTLLIGIDGLEPKYLIRWKDLYYFHRMMGEGSFGYLMSTLPSRSIPAWLSFKTGKNPGRFGVYEFEKRVIGSYYCQPSFIKNVGKSFWEFLSDANYRVGVVNIPFTHPAKKVNGIMITAMDVNNPAAYYPRELYDQLHKRFKRARQTLREAGLRGVTDKVLLHDWEKIVLNQIELYTYLLEGDFDFFACGLDVDTLQHYIRNEAIIHNAYFFLDNAVKMLVRRAKPDNVFIISDHGGDICQGVLQLNTFLQTQGFLTLVKDIQLPFIEYIIKILGKVLEVPQLARSPLYRFISKFYSPMVSYNKMVCKIDWSRTLAYSPSHACIFLNLQGREPNGIVSESEYMQICEKIAKKLSNIRDKNGKKIETKVFFKNEIYEDKYLFEMPDLVIDIPYYTSSVRFTNQVITDPPPLSVCHSLFGTIIATGKDIGEGVQLSDARITSVAPTILHIYGIPIPEYMDRVLLELFRPNSDLHIREPRIVCTQPDIDSEGRDLSREEEETIVERLMRLGYL